MGTKIPALQIAANQFVGVASITTLGLTTLDPAYIANATEREKENNPRLKAAAEQRGTNQRAFDKKRMGRRNAYAQYIHDVDAGVRRGGYPPITFWCKDDITYRDGFLDVPGATILTANDGETQLAARYMLAAQDPAALDKNFAFTLVVASDRETAMQTLHDMNHYATPVSEKDTAALNVEGSLTKAINAGVQESGRDFGIIKPRTEKVSGNYYTTVPILLHGAIGALNGQESLAKTPSSQIQAANGQFVQLNGGADRVRGFIAEVMRLDGVTLSKITVPHMMALGVKFNQSNRVVAPLSPAVVDMIVKKTKGEKNRVTVQTVAREICAALAD